MLAEANDVAAIDTLVHEARGAVGDAVKGAEPYDQS
jgi:hypothetical protein